MPARQRNGHNEEQHPARNCNGKAEKNFGKGNVSAGCVASVVGLQKTFRTYDHGKAWLRTLRMSAQPQL